MPDVGDPNKSLVWIIGRTKTRKIPTEPPLEVQYNVPERVAALEQLEGPKETQTNSVILKTPSDR